MVLPFVAPLGYVCASAGPEETKNQRGEILRLIQIRLATPSLAKLTPARQAHSPHALITDSSSINAVSFLKRLVAHGVDLAILVCHQIGVHFSDVFGNNARQVIFHGSNRSRKNLFVFF